MKLKSILSTAMLVATSTHAFAWVAQDGASPVCVAVIDKTNQNFAEVTEYERHNPNPSSMSLDSMNLSMNQELLWYSEGIRDRLHNLETKIAWLVVNKCFPLEAQPKWQAVLDQHIIELQRLDAVVWGLRKLIERDQH